MAEEWRLHPIRRPQSPTLDTQSSQSSHLLGACLVQGIGSGQPLIEIAVFYPDGNKGAQEGKGLWATRLRSLPKAARVFTQRGKVICSTRQWSLDTPSLFGRIWHPVRSDLTSGIDA